MTTTKGTPLTASCRVRLLDMRNRIQHLEGLLTAIEEAEARGELLLSVSHCAWLLVKLDKLSTKVEALAEWLADTLAEAQAAPSHTLPGGRT